MAVIPDCKVPRGKALVFHWLQAVHVVTRLWCKVSVAIYETLNTENKRRGKWKFGTNWSLHPI